MKVFLIAVLLATGGVWSQDDIINNLNLPDNVEVPNKNEDIKKAVKEKCIKANDEQAFLELQAGKEKFKSCLASIIDIVKVQEDVEKMQEDIDSILLSQEMYNVSVLYCKQGPAILNCLEHFTEKWEKCLFDDEVDGFQLITNLTEISVEFLCHEEATRIQTFITDGGMRCLIERRDSLQECFNKTIKNMWLSDVSFDDIHLLSYFANCKTYENFQNCIVKQFETCKENNSATVIEDLLDHIRTSLPCKNVEENDTEVRNETELYREDEIISQPVENSSTIKKRGKRSFTQLFYGLEEKCGKNSQTPHVYDSVIDSYHHLMTHTMSNMFMTYGECSVKIKELMTVSDRLITNLEECLSEEKYLPKLIKDSVESCSSYMCRDDGKLLHDLEASLAIPCLLRQGREKLNMCLETVSEYPIKDGEVIYEKPIFCKNLNLLKTCVHNVLKTLNCSSYPSLLELVDGLLEALYLPCCGNFAFLNRFMLLCILAFSMQKLFT